MAWVTSSAGPVYLKDLSWCHSPANIRPSNKELNPTSQLNPYLTHWGLVTHICVSHLTIGSDNGLSPGCCQAIVWTNDLLLIWTLGTKFSEILNELHTFSFKKMHLKMQSVSEMAAILFRSQCVNTLKLKKKGLSYCRWHFQVNFLEWRWLNF